MMGISPTFRVMIEGGQYLECTHNHKIFVNGDEHKTVSQLGPGDAIFTLAGFRLITSITPTGRTEQVYDLIDVAGGHRYYTNGILSSNCEFITFEETLINSMKLSKLESKSPIRKTGQVRWYSEIRREHTYVVALDPSMGTGGDNAAIQVIELPTLVQVAEWSSNKTPVEDQVRTVKAILEELDSYGHPELYWSVESNGMGEAALVVIRDTGEESFPGTMLHDPRNRQNGRYGRRSGFLTTNKTKLEACARLKSLLESGRLQLHSRGILSELKTFVSRSNTYEARPGQTDDLIMALVLAIRMIDYIATWDDASQEAISSNIDVDNNYDAPMPIFI